VMATERTGADDGSLKRTLGTQPEWGQEESRRDYRHIRSAGGGKGDS
jgi:hypothetical protein